MYTVLAKLFHDVWVHRSGMHLGTVDSNDVDVLLEELLHGLKIYYSGLLSVDELTGLGLKVGHTVTLFFFFSSSFFFFFFLFFSFFFSRPSLFVCFFLGDVIVKIVLVWGPLLGHVGHEEGQCDQLLPARQFSCARGVVGRQCKPSMVIGFRHLELFSHQVVERTGPDSWNFLARLGVVPLES